MSELITATQKSLNGEKPVEKRTMKHRFRKNWQIWVKLLELVLCIVCILMAMEPIKRGDLPVIYLSHCTLIFATFLTYFLVVCVFFIGKITGDEIPYRTGFVLSALASCLFFVCGIFLAIDGKTDYFFNTEMFDPQPHVLIMLALSSAFSFFSSLVFAAESISIWRCKADF